MIALNIADLTLIPRPLTSFILPPDIAPSRTIIDAEPGRLDGKALLLECDEERARALADLIARLPTRYPIRVYESGPRGGWRRRPRSR